MKPLRLILPITLFILSGVLAWVGGQINNNFMFSFWIVLVIGFLLTGVLISLIWALGGFDD